MKTDKSIWKAFVVFFREIKGYENWSEEDIDISMNEDDIEEFIKYARIYLNNGKDYEK